MIRSSAVVIPRWKYIVAGLSLVVLAVAIVASFWFFSKEDLAPRRQRRLRTSRPTTQATTSTTMATPTSSAPPVDNYRNPSYMDACYSVRVVVPDYNGPVIKLEKNDGTQQDIYTDATQSYLTVDPNGQGMSVANWLDAGVGKVRVWYDQSGNGNHATCYSYCPILSTLDSSKYVLKFQQYTDSGLRIQPVQPNAIFFQFWHDNNNPAKIISTDVDPAISQYYGVVIQNGDIYGNKSQYDWYYVGSGGKDFTVNETDSPTYNLGQWNTVCLSIQNPNYPADNKEDLTLIGKDLSGYMSELILYNRPMTQQDMDAYNNNKLEVEDS